MKIDYQWRDYEVIATGDGMKLERWDKYTLLRPDPQIIWPAKTNLRKYPGLDAIYERSSTGGGAWNMLHDIPADFTVSWKDYTFSLKLMGFKHTGLFPEQAVNWERMTQLIEGENRPISVLNLFAYTGGATVVCTGAGATVCHVDAAKAMVDRAKENLSLSGLRDRPVRFIVDDCVAFCQRELRRGHKYDAIIMDPPSYGRGPKGETWKIETSLYPLVELASQLLSDDPLFFLINSYTTGLQPSVMSNILASVLGDRAEVEAYEVGLPTDENGIVLPCGASAIATF